MNPVFFVITILPAFVVIVIFEAPGLPYASNVMTSGAELIVRSDFFVVKLTIVFSSPGR